MITDSGDIKVMDFGIARATDDIGATMTNTWNVIGTALQIIKNNPDFVKHQKGKGRRVFVWTVNESADVKLCEQAGVDVIMSDNPAQARKALGYS